MGVVASPSYRRLLRERGVETEPLVAGLVHETVVREDPPSGISSPTVAASPSGSTGNEKVDHCEWGAVSREPLTRVAEVAAASLSAAQLQTPAVTRYDSVDATRFVTSLRALMAMPLASTV